MEYGWRHRIPQHGMVRVVAVFGCCLWLWAAPAQAEECRVLAERMLEQHPRLNAVRREVQVARAQLDRSRGGWFPDLRTSGAVGPESRKKTSAAISTQMTARTLTMTVNQLLWDFGKTDAEIAKADLAVAQAELALSGQRAELLLDAASSCINLVRGYRALAMAEQSVANIRKQTGLEESRVELGGGLQTDALQARSQLSGAQARHARAKGTLNMAINHFRGLFASAPGAPETLHELENPTHQLPDSLEKVLAEVQANNPQILTAKVAFTLSQTEKKRLVGAELSPRVGAVVEQKYKQDSEGIDGRQDETSARLEFSYPFNLGMASFHALTGAEEGIAVAESRLGDTRNQVEEQARNGWENLKTARENAEYLDNQARIAAEFLRMAREERLHGARSLIDVLSGETGLINAQSDAVAAWADVAIAQFALLKTMGLLDLDALRTGPRLVLAKVETDGRETDKRRDKEGEKTAPTPVPVAELVRKRSGKEERVEVPVENPQPPERSREAVAAVPAAVPAREEAASGEQAEVIENTSVRVKPDRHAKVVNFLRAGTAVRVVEEKSLANGRQWVRLEGEGWVSAAVVSRKSGAGSAAPAAVPAPVEAVTEPRKTAEVVEPVAEKRKAAEVVEPVVVQVEAESKPAPAAISVLPVKPVAEKRKAAEVVEPVVVQVEAESGPVKLPPPSPVKPLRVKRQPAAEAASGLVQVEEPVKVSSPSPKESQPEKRAADAVAPVLIQVEEPVSSPASAPVSLPPTREKRAADAVEPALIPVEEARKPARMAEPVATEPKRRQGKVKEPVEQPVLTQVEEPVKASAPVAAAPEAVQKRPPERVEPVLTQVEEPVKAAAPVAA
ncbi:MAG: TolC family protein, partial [Magnetococcales bacterium]|nr:TolC family protein [Magnetococcales bacterium]